MSIASSFVGPIVLMVALMLVVARVGYAVFLRWLGCPSNL
jgi:hypothetical protein